MDKDNALGRYNFKNSSVAHSAQKGLKGNHQETLTTLEFRKPVYTGFIENAKCIHRRPVSLGTEKNTKPLSL